MNIFVLIILTFPTKIFCKIIISCCKWKYSTATKINFKQSLFQNIYWLEKGKKEKDKPETSAVKFSPQQMSETLNGSFSSDGVGDWRKVTPSPSCPFDPSPKVYTCFFSDINERKFMMKILCSFFSLYIYFFFIFIFLFFWRQGGLKKF